VRQQLEREELPPQEAEKRVGAVFIRALDREPDDVPASLREMLLGVAKEVAHRSGLDAVLEALSAVLPVWSEGAYVRVAFRKSVSVSTRAPDARGRGYHGRTPQHPKQRVTSQAWIR
jgi:hypothetical protein